MEKLRYLITGTGRCGTGYVAMVLRSIGVQCGHEDVFELGGLEYARQVLATGVWEAESSWLAAPFLKSNILKKTAIVHLVRHPLPVIRSQLSRREGYLADNRWYEFRKQHLPTLERYKEQWVRAAHLYIEWNRMIETCGRRIIFHRVEDDICQLLDKLKLNYRGKKLFDNKKYNSRRHRIAVDLNKLPKSLRQQMINIRRQYSYED